MIKVQVFGVFRLDTGIKEFELDEESEQVYHVKDLYPILIKMAKNSNPAAEVNKKSIDGCIVVVNDKQVKKTHKLKNGDKVQLMSPLCGG